MKILKNLFFSLDNDSVVITKESYDRYRENIIELEMELAEARQTIKYQREIEARRLKEKRDIEDELHIIRRIVGLSLGKKEDINKSTVEMVTEMVENKKKQIIVI